MNQTTSVNNSPSKGTVIYFETQILKHAEPVIVLDKLALTKPMPKNKGTVIEWRRPNVFTASDVPLTEGVTPTSTAFTYSVVQATLKQYGQVGEITDVIEDTTTDPVLNDLSVQLGENVGRTIESLTYGVVKAGTAVEYTNGSARTDVNTPISLAKIRKATRTLKSQKGLMINRTLDPSQNYGTRAIEAGYVACGHTDLEPDIRDLPGFTPVSEYGHRKTISEYECGSVERTRFVLSPDLVPWADGGGAKSGSGTEMVSTTGTSADVYPLIVFAKESFGSVPLKGMGAVEPTIIPVGQKTKDDPLGQRGFAGWKTWFVCKVLNEAWMDRIECAATAL